MKVLIHEWVTGGGLSGRPLPRGWAAEGRAMRRALADDFQAVGGVEVVITLDPRFVREAGPWRPVPVRPGEDEETLARLAAGCDLTVLIAPETGGLLEQRTRALERAGARGLGSTPEAVALTADKLRLAAHLKAEGVETPPAERFDPSRPRLPSFGFPAVIKPVDGAGSTDTFLVANLQGLPTLTDREGGWIVQPYQAGRAMSASFLVGVDGEVALLGVGWQTVEVIDGRFEYRGGRLLALRELGLGEPLRAVRDVGGLCGYIGVDFIDRGPDLPPTVIEINPRLTTSFVGLQRLYPPGAIARAWLAAAQGEPFAEGLERVAPDPSGPGLRFFPDGRVGPGEGVRS
jgi:predicted ATP-grasp superfamily ATP-dependent carboligase